MSQLVYRVAKWTEVFETADSRRHKKLNWVALPISFQSSGYQTLVDERPEDAAEIYGAWCVLLLVAAQCPERGVLANSRGRAITPERAAQITYMPLSSFEKLFAWASQEHIGWLEVTSPNDCEPVDERSPNDRQPVANRSSNELRNVRNVTEHNPTERTKERAGGGGDHDQPEPSKTPVSRRPPSVDEVRAHCEQRGNGIDAEAFVAHYTANGWKQSNGRALYDWHAAIVTWEKNRKPKAGSGGKPQTRRKADPSMFSEIDQ